VKLNKIDLFRVGEEGRGGVKVEGGDQPLNKKALAQIVLFTSQIRFELCKHE